MDCEAAMDRLDELVDRELDSLQVSEIEGHFRHCPQCEERYELQRGLNRVVKRCCNQAQAPAGLRRSVEGIFKGA